MSKNQGASQLPYQLVLDTILPLLDIQTLIRLRAVSHAFKEAVDDNVVWRRRIRSDFRFPLQSSARTTGWKTIYRGLANPELYTWGEESHYRLGVEIRKRQPNQDESEALEGSDFNLIKRYRSAPFPLSIKWRNADLYDSNARVTECHQFDSERPPNFEIRQGIPLRRILPNGRESKHSIDVGVPVEIHAGGWSFFLMTNKGQIITWGSSTGNGDSSGTEEMFQKPTLLDLNGRQATSLSVGRQHAVAQMDDGSIFEWSNRWDRPAVHFQSSILKEIQTKEELHIDQVEAGWNFSAALVNSDHGEGVGNVLIWESRWTYDLQRAMWYERAIQEGADSSTIEPTWQVAVPTVLLPVPPKRFTRIAAGDRFIIALSDDGLVYYLEIPEIRQDLRTQASDTPQASADRLRKELDRRYTQWKKLSSFCENVRQAGQESEDGENVWDRPGLNHLLSSNVRITHISAQFKNFAVYAPEAGKEGRDVDVQSGKGLGIVLLGSNDAHLRPKIIPELQGVGVIKIVQGDWHSGALLLDGSVRTWGSQSNGALGTWDSIPTVEGAQSVFSAPQPPTNDFFSNMGGLVTGIFRPAMQARQQAHIRMQQEQAEAQSKQQSGEHQQGESSSRSNNMVKAEKDRYLLRNLPDQQPEPKAVRFGFPKVGEMRNGKRIEESDSMETKYAFDIAFAGWHSGALAVDRALIFDS
ncbi:RCC1/BLIP-II [Meira miltonrushii]|uniref:RCC1/BLIP-II n=1 Tax=Meira miltonrushii TaxID=1280837 RepID=A0A316V9I5_9BASI|nr:RCC1/BLIP-II [Meira miltonrushii]PWN34257.1 RCC1/BLIP-II [Meira miltonrushii]